MRLLFAFIIVLTSFHTSNAQVAFNGNFEKLVDGEPTGWNMAYNTKPSYQIKLDSVVKLHGKYSVSISNNTGEGNFGAINHHIRQTFIGESLTLFGSMKTENVKGYASLFLSVNGVNGQIDAADVLAPKLSGTNNWKDFYIQMPYNESEAISLDVGAYLKGTGKIWLDSLRLYVDDSPVSKAPLALFKAVNDTAFSRGSDIKYISLNKEVSAHLTLLGQLWGFLKYHHPAIAKGDYNWDNELFRLLPRYLKCKSNAQVTKLLEQWLDNLGKPELCLKCKPWTATKNIAVEPNYGKLFNNKVFSKSLHRKLEYILNNHDSTYNYYVSLPLVPVFTHEKSFESMYPDAGYRLLALYRYWNVIQYFYPNRNLITEDWNTILPKFIPQIIASRNKTEYALTLNKLVTHIHDGHAFIQSSVIDNYQGAYRLPVAAHFVEGKLVVTGYYKDTLEVKQKFKVGDIITSINGIQVTKLMKQYLPLMSSSNYDSKLRDLPCNYLLKGSSKQFNLSILRNGKIAHITAYAAELAKINAYDFNRSPNAKEPGYYLINRHIGYIFASLFKIGNIQEIKKTFKDTKGIIIDMRAYPTDEMEQTLGRYLKPYVSPFVKFTNGSLKYPGLFTFGEPSVNGNKSDDYYKGRVIVLVNALTQSNAEYVTMALQSAPKVTVVGSSSAGADGNITKSIVLPGMFYTYISGLGVYYPDGTNTQRNGVKINYVVKPTIKGVKENTDEVLDKAKELILGSRSNEE